MISEGRSINVTLIFSLERYADVIEAYQSGLEELVASGGDPSRVASVASFFVSRVDTEMDRRLEGVADSSPELAERALSLRGKAAVAQARLAYELFEQRFDGARWQSLASAGAALQRPLWASTSTKNASYPDLIYVDSLIGPHTVNTMPEPTVEAFLDHGVVGRTVDSDVDASRQLLDDLKELGVDVAEVAATLETEGVASFAKSFDELVEQLEQKSAALGVKP